MHIVGGHDGSCERNASCDRWWFYMLLEPEAAKLLGDVGKEWKRSRGSLSGGANPAISCLGGAPTTQ